MNGSQEYSLATGSSIFSGNGISPGTPLQAVIKGARLRQRKRLTFSVDRPRIGMSFPGLYMRSYFTTSMVTLPSAKKEI